MKSTVLKHFSLLLVAALMFILIATGCSKAPDDTGFSNADELLSALELTEDELLPFDDSTMIFEAADPDESSTYYLTFTAADASVETFELWAESLREITKELDIDGYCRVVHNTGGIKDEEPHDSHHCWYIAYSAEKSIKYLAYRADESAFVLKIQFEW